MIFPRKAIDGCWFAEAEASTDSISDAVNRGMAVDRIIAE